MYFVFGNIFPPRLVLSNISIHGHMIFLSIFMA